MMISLLVVGASAAMLPPLVPTPAPASLLSSVASLVLRSRLQRMESVDVDVQAAPGSLLSGCVDAVTVSGRGWCTPLNLSCASLRVTVGRTAIDLGGLVSTRQILLQQPAIGDAQMAFSAPDWANFLKHPLMRESVAAQIRKTGLSLRHGVSFARSSARIVRGRLEGDRGGVEFTLDWDARPMIARLGLASSGKVVVDAHYYASTPSAAPQIVNAESTSEEQAASVWLASLFQTLLIDLDGCELRFRSLCVRMPRAREAASTRAELCLDLDVRVRSFPSLDINF